MIASIYFANEEMSLENKQGIKDVYVLHCGGWWNGLGPSRREEEAVASFVLYLVYQNMAGVGEQSIVL